MRTIIVVLFLLLYTIVSLPMYLIGFILGKMDPKKKVRMFTQRHLHIILR